MPPSGFSQKAINGLLEFVRSSYKATFLEFNSDRTQSEKEFLSENINLLKERLRETLHKNMPLEIDESGINGLVIFITTCYEDLVEEINKGQDIHGRLVIEGQAMEKEINQIGSYLENFTI